MHREFGDVKHLQTEGKEREAKQEEKEEEEEGEEETKNKKNKKEQLVQGQQKTDNLMLWMFVVCARSSFF